MKKLATLVCAFAVLAFAAGAQAQNDEAEVDWDEAIEFAEVTDTYVENNVEWVTYYDELQGVMWSQPADATPEAVKAYFTGDRETLKDLGLDWICAWQWLVPYEVKLLDDMGPRTVYEDDILYDRAGPLGVNYHKIWRAYGGYSSFLDVDTYVRSMARSTFNYTDDYNGRFRGPQDPGWSDDCDYEDAYYLSGYYRYPVYEANDVNNWNYYLNYCYPLAKHEFHACDYWRYLEVEFCTLNVE